MRIFTFLLIPLLAGLTSMLSSALVGGALLALIEGVGIVVSHYSADSYRQVSPVERQQRYKQELLRQQRAFLHSQRLMER